MDKFISLAFLVGAVKVLTVLSTPGGYYWREFEGEIPTDALPISSLNNETDYIGQAMQITLVLPGIVDIHQKLLYYEWGDAEQKSKNFKILCSNEPENFEWIATSVWNFKTLNLGNKRLVMGGIDDIFKVFIGRTYAGGEMLIGKILIRPSDSEAVLHVTTKDHKAMAFLQFDVLAYNQGAREREPSCKQVVLKFYDQC